MTDPVMAVSKWKNNAELIVSVHKLGYLLRGHRTLDPTWGNGVFWKLWRPDDLVGSDIDIARSPSGTSIDFRKMPYADAEFDRVVLDGPYRLNGTPTPAFDEKYGTHVRASWQDRMQMIRDGITECARVVKPGGLVMVKCADQVCSGAVRWQTIDFANHGATVGLELVDQLHMVGSRPQPERTRKDGKPSVQKHARRNLSTLQIYRRSVG